MPDNIAVFATVILLLPMMYFLPASPAFLLVALNIRPVALLMRAMFNGYFLTLAIAGATGVNCCRRFLRSSAAAPSPQWHTPPKPKDASDLPPPKRALTAEMKPGKSVFKSFDVTSKVVEIDNNSGLTFYETYITEGVPRLTGLEPDPMLKGTIGFPGPGGTMFRLISYPPRRPEGWKPPPGATFETGIRELSEKVPGMGDVFERDAPGMHTSDTIDYGVVVRGEMTLELDDGQKVHLRQGDTIVQNGTRHRWRNPLPEPCLMAFVSVGGRRG